MDALGALGPLEVIEGKIQEKVARFLALKSMINTLRVSPQINIASQAEGLMVKQLALEDGLTVTLDNIKQLKSGPWDMGSVVTIGGFAMEMMKQINAVKDLEKNAVQNNAMPQSTFSSGMDMAGMLGNPMILGVAALAIGWFVLKK